jgi:hypothetical protein
MAGRMMAGVQGRSLFGWRVAHVLQHGRLSRSQGFQSGQGPSQYRLSYQLLRVQTQRQPPPRRCEQMRRQRAIQSYTRQPDCQDGERFR